MHNPAAPAVNVEQLPVEELNLTTCATLAYQMNLSPIQASALPATIRVAARHVQMTGNELMRECFSNLPLRRYLAGICTEVTI